MGEVKVNVAGVVSAVSSASFPEAAGSGIKLDDAEETPAMEPQQ